MQKADNYCVASVSLSENSLHFRGTILENINAFGSEMTGGKSALLA